MIKQTNKNKAWKLSEKKEHSEYGGPNATGAADFSSEIMKTTKQWNLEKSKNSAMHKIIALKKRKITAFSNQQKQRGFATQRPFQRLTKEVL